MRPVLICLVGVACAVVVLAGQARQTNTPQFRTGVDIVELDVSVYDKDHHPIHGLKAADFTLLEDRVERPLVAVSEVHIADPPPPSAPWVRDAASDVATNDIADHQLFLIVVDDASFGKELMFKVQLDELKNAVMTFIRHLGPKDLAAVVFTGDNRRSQEFTTDHQRLMAAVEQTWGPIVPSKDLYAVEALRRAADYLISVPGRRKTFVDFTKFDMGMICRIQGEQDSCHLVTQTERIFESAQQAGINIHIMRMASRFDDALRAPSDDPNTEGRWSLRLPKETGGQTFYGLREPKMAEAAAAEIFELNRSYYMLGYTSGDIKKFHFVKVLVNRPGAEVRTRDKYYWPEKPPEPPPAGALGAMAGLLPKSDLPLRVTVAPFASASGASLAIALGVHHAREGSARAVREKLDLRVGTFTAEGTPRGSDERALALTLPASRGDLDYELLTRVDVAKPGLYELRLSAHSSVLAKDGAVYVTVDVPDFSKAPISMSGIVVSGDPERVLDGRERVAAIVPIVPTVERTFAKTDRATAFLKIYEGGGAIAPIDAHIKIVDDHDRAVVDRVEPLPPSHFDGQRSASVAVPLPLGTLVPGDYLLSIEAARGKTTARRELRFSVK